MKKLTLVIVVGLLMFSSCAWLREKRAENHQPFKLHHDKKLRKKHR